MCAYLLVHASRCRRVGEGVSWGAHELGAVEGGSGHSNCGPGKVNQSLVFFRKKR